MAMMLMALQRDAPRGRSMCISHPEVECRLTSNGVEFQEQHLILRGGGEEDSVMRVALLCVMIKSLFFLDSCFSLSRQLLHQPSSRTTTLLPCPTTLRSPPNDPSSQPNDPSYKRPTILPSPKTLRTNFSPPDDPSYKLPPPTTLRKPTNK